MKLLNSLSSLTLANIPTPSRYKQINIIILFWFKLVWDGDSSDKTKDVLKEELYKGNNAGDLETEDAEKDEVLESVRTMLTGDRYSSNSILRENIKYKFKPV